MQPFQRFALVAAGHQVEIVVTRRDTRRSRRGEPEPSPVKRAAVDLGIEVTDELEEVRGANAELGVVVAYGRIIPQSILDVLPMVNVHFSLLPRWRGAAPVERAILAGDATTGVCVMRLEAGLDTGPVLARAEVPIGPEETADELKERLAVLGADLLADVLSVGVSELPQGEPQHGEVTYAAKIEPEELELHFDAPAIELARLVRAGRAWTTFRGARLIVVSARAHPDDRDAVGASDPGALAGTRVMTPEGTLELVEVQPEGRKRIGAAEWLRGRARSPASSSAPVKSTSRLAGVLRIAPSVLSADFGGLAEAVGGVAQEADWLHIDVMDGHFVPNLTIGPPVVESLRRHTGLFFDCHLMMTNPGDYLEAFKKAGADGCSVHVEVGETAELLRSCRELGMSAGLALNPETPAEAVEPFLELTDLLLCMTVHPGFGGQEFMHEVLPKIERLRAELDRRELGAELQVDGGIDERTAPLVVGAGARVLVAGSAVFGDDRPWEAVRRIRAAGRAALPAKVDFEPLTGDFEPPR